MYCIGGAAILNREGVAARWDKAGISATRNSREISREDRAYENK